MKNLISDKSLTTAAFLMLATLAILNTGMAVAGADATFLTAQTYLNSWITGSLGRMVALASLGIGVVSAIVSRTLMPVVVSAGVGIAASVGPTVVTSIVTATL